MIWKEQKISSQSILMQEQMLDILIKQPVFVLILAAYANSEFILTFEDGARLEIMNQSDLVDNEKVLLRTGYVHIAFSVGSKASVDSLTERLKRDGYQVVSNPRTTGDGYYESCIRGIEGNLIEITE